MWSMQIYRAVRRARTSGLSVEYLVGTSVCRLFYMLCKSLHAEPSLTDKTNVTYRLHGLPQQYLGHRT